MRILTDTVGWHVYRDCERARPRITTISRMRVCGYRGFFRTLLTVSVLTVIIPVGDDDSDKQINPVSLLRVCIYQLKTADLRVLYWQALHFTGAWPGWRFFEIAAAI